MLLIGANYDCPANMFNFYFKNEQSGKYSTMCVANVFGASDMYHEEYQALVTEQ